MEEKPDLPPFTAAILDELKALNETPLFRAAKEIGRVKDEPRLLVIITHGMVELMVNTLIDAHCKNASKITSNTRDFPHSSKLVILHEKGVLSDHHFGLLNWFRKLRNDAVHDPFFTLTPVRLEPLADEQMRQPDNFHTVCSKLLGDLWMTFSNDIGPVFIPNLYRTVETPQLMRSMPAKIQNSSAERPGKD